MLKSSAIAKSLNHCTTESLNHREVKRQPIPFSSLMLRRLLKDNALFVECEQRRKFIVERIIDIWNIWEHQVVGRSSFNNTRIPILPGIIVNDLDLDNWNWIMNANTIDTVDLLVPKGGSRNSVWTLEGTFGFLFPIPSFSHELMNATNIIEYLYSCLNFRHMAFDKL